MYPRSCPLSHTRTTSLSFCICNDYNALSSNNIIIHLNLCLQMVSGKWREMLETCTKTLMCKQPRHACLRCSRLKHACLDLLCKRALRNEFNIFRLIEISTKNGRKTVSGRSTLLQKFSSYEYFLHDLSNILKKCSNTF